MPYGVAKRAGGDSPENNAKVERCVSSLVAKGYEKVSAIRICKSSVQGDTKHKPKRKG